MKLIKKILPVNIYDIESLESYLSDMAAKGYFVKKLSEKFAKFELKERRKVEYRFIPIPKKTREENKENIYKGTDYWKHILTINGFNLYMSEEENPENIDKEYKLDETLKRFKINTILFFVLAIIMVFILLYDLLFSDYKVLGLIKFTNVTMIINGIVMTVFYSRYFIGYRKIKALKNKIDKGEKINHKKEYKISYKSYFIDTVTLVILLTLLFTMCFNNRFSRNLLNYKGEIPTLRLEEIEKNTNVKAFDEGYLGIEKNLLAKQIIKVFEQGKSSNEYYPYIDSEFYELRFEFLAEPLANDLIKRQDEWSGYTSNIKEVEKSSFDYLKILETKYEDEKYLVGKVDNKVIFISYYGNEDLEKFTEDIYEKVINFDEIKKNTN